MISVSTIVLYLTLYTVLSHSADTPRPQLTGSDKTLCEVLRISKDKDNRKSYLDNTQTGKSEYVGKKLEYQSPNNLIVKDRRGKELDTIRLTKELDAQAYQGKYVIIDKYKLPTDGSFLKLVRGGGRVECSTTELFKRFENGYQPLYAERDEYFECAGVIYYPVINKDHYVVLKKRGHLTGSLFGTNRQWVPVWYVVYRLENTRLEYLCAEEAVPEEPKDWPKNVPHIK